MDGSGLEKVFSTFFKGVLLVGVGLGVAVTGAIWGVKALSDSGAVTVGVHLNDNQATLHKNGALCDADLTKAFALSKQKGKLVELEGPLTSPQNCPKP